MCQYYFEDVEMKYGALGMISYDEGWLDDICTENRDWDD